MLLRRHHSQVGPLGKEEFLNAIGSVDMKTAFPDFQGEFYNFNVDPFEGNRVWYIARGRGTNTGPLPPFAPTATGKSLVNPPQACSLTFNEAGLVIKYTIGYIMDRSAGNTGGLGGLYGVLYAIGKPLPFPEARPWKMSKRFDSWHKFMIASATCVPACSASNLCRSMTRCACSIQYVF